MVNPHMSTELDTLRKHNAKLRAEVLQWRAVFSDKETIWCVRGEMMDPLLECRAATDESGALAPP